MLDLSSTLLLSFKDEEKGTREGLSNPDTTVAADAAQPLRFYHHSMYQIEDFWRKSGACKNVTLHGNSKASPKTGTMKG